MFGEPLLLPTKRRSGVHQRLSQLGIAGGAAYDGLIGLEARSHERTLVTRDLRAAATYALVGASVELIPASPERGGFRGREPAHGRGVTS